MGAVVEAAGAAEGEIDLKVVGGVTMFQQAMGFADAGELALQPLRFFIVLVD